jgi:hypothetical protein
MQGPKIPGGYILVSRKLIESEIWEKPPLYLKVWMYLLMRAQYKPFKDLDRGELVVSIPELIEACSYKVGYRTEKPTKSQIYNILEWLRNSNEASHERYTNETMIDTAKTTRGMVVKVSNYNVYQDSKNYEQNDEGNNEKPMNDTMPKRQADTINKKEKKDKELKNKEIKDISRKRVFDNDSVEMILTQFFISEIRKNSADFKQPNLQTWSDEFRKIIELDKRDKAEVSKLIRWVQQDDFEKPNVLSPSKLRKRYDALKIKMLNPLKKRESKEKVPEWFANKDEPITTPTAIDEDPNIAAEREALKKELGG